MISLFQSFGYCHRNHRSATFSEVTPGAPMWYENSSALVEIAVNQGRASDQLGLAIGDAIALDP